MNGLYHHLRCERGRLVLSVFSKRSGNLGSISIFMRWLLVLIPSTTFHFHFWARDIVDFGEQPPDFNLDIHQVESLA